MKAILFIIMISSCMSSFASTEIIITKNGTYRTTTNKIIARVYNERIQSSNGTTLGWVNKESIRNKHGVKIGLIQNNKVLNSSGQLLGFIDNNGTIRDSHGKLLGTVKNVRREWLAVYYFFHILK